MLTSPSSFALIGHRTLELYYFILFYFFLFFIFLFFFIFFYFFYFYFILFYFILFYFILFYFILFYFILFYFILFYFILFYFILFYFCETSQYLALFTDPVTDLAQKVWPIFQHFSSKSLSFNMADLGVNVSDNIRCDVINSYLLT